MTSRTFFILLIKLIGIYIVLSSIAVFPQFVFSLFELSYTGDNNNAGMIIWSLFVLFLTLGIYFILVKYCIYRTDWIINKFSLDKHFPEEKIELNIHRSTVLSISIIVIGGIMFVNGIPSFWNEVYDYFLKNQSVRMFDEKPTTRWMFFYFIKILIGYLLMTNQRLIVNWIERQRKGKVI